MSPTALLPNRARPFRARRGMTLVELLVVVSIIVLLAAAAAPLVKNTLEGQKVRSAARQVNVFFAGARGRTAQLGRPAGVWIDRNNEAAINGPAHSVRLFMAETPPPYCGDVLGARAVLLDVHPVNQPDGMAETAQFDAFSASLPFLVQVGDGIRFDYKGPLYQITSIDPATYQLTFRLLDARYSPGVDGAWGRKNVDDNANGIVDDVLEAGWIGSDDVWLSPPGPQLAGNTGGYPYQIYRRPVKSSVSPLLLPRGIAADLTVSGIGATGTEFAPAVLPPPAQDTTPVVIMFSPSGDVESVRVHDLAVRPTGTIHLLLGRVEQVTPDDPTTPAVDERFYCSEGEREHLHPNAMDAESIWVSIGHRTGAVASTENNELHKRVEEQKRANPQWAPTPQQLTQWLLWNAREFAQEGQAMGGL